MKKHILLRIIYIVFSYKLLTHFMPQVSFYTPWKHQKTKGIESEYRKGQWHEKG